MTVPLAPGKVIDRVRGKHPETDLEQCRETLLVPPISLLEVMGTLKDDPELDFEYLVSLSAVDYFNHFEVVYHLVSIAKNHSLVVKTRVRGRRNPVLPSVTGIWQGADLQEREAYDLMGISFEGHPNLKRILTWEGFVGHPQRKDYL